MPFALRPADVLAAPERYPLHFRRTLRSDLRHPVDLALWSGEWIVLDGVHRLAKAAYLGAAVVAARKVPAELLPAFAVTCPLACHRARGRRRRQFPASGRGWDRTSDLPRVKRALSR